MILRMVFPHSGCGHLILPKLGKNNWNLRSEAFHRAQIPLIFPKVGKTKWPPPP